MIKKLVEEKIQQAVDSLDISEKVRLEHPANMDFGDYTTNIAMQAAKQLKKNPFEIAQEIIKKLPPDDLFEKVEVIKPGFINIWLQKNLLLNVLKDISIQKEKFGNNTFYNKKKIVVEFTDPNPFKEFHIGHLYVNMVGESLSRLYEANGAEVKRVNYQGDVGMHVAKSIWGMVQKMKDDSLSVENLKNLSLNERINFLGKAYAKGSEAFSENEAIKEEIKNINLLVYITAQEFLKETSNWEPQVDYKKHLTETTIPKGTIKELYSLGRSWSLEYFEQIYKRLGTKFDGYYFESIVGEYGVRIVREFLQKGVFEESEGAIIFPGEKHGLHTRVFINSLGLPTYEAKELGLAPTKYKDFPHDESLIITGNEIDEYFKVLIEALKKVNPELGKKTKHISHGMVRLPEGKMSSRTGNVVTGESLIEEVKLHVKEMVNSSEKAQGKDSDEIAEKITIAAIKYSLLKASIGRDIVFDFKESLSLEGNSGPYLQYAYARCMSLLEKNNSALGEGSLPTELTSEELRLIRSLAVFPDIVSEASLHLSPNLLTNYLFTLSQTFNLFYQKNPVLKADEKTKQFRLLLTQFTAQIIKNGLHLLGIETVEKM